VTSNATKPSAGDAHAWSRAPGNPNAAIQLRIRLTPKSSRDAIDGPIATPTGPAIKVRVRAVPENGAANKALIATVANWLGVPKTNITVSSGAKSRTKVLTIKTPTSVGAQLIAQQINDLSNEDLRP